MRYLNNYIQFGCLKTGYPPNFIDNLTFYVLWNMRFLISVSHVGHLILGCNGSKILEFWCKAPRSDFFFRFVWKDGALELHVSEETGTFCNIIPAWWFGT